MADLRRVNIRITEEVHEYFKDKSIKTGVSMSALMYLALEEYMNQRNIINTIPDMMKKAKTIEDQQGGYKIV